MTFDELTYDQIFTMLVGKARNDKNLTQPWKNYALSDTQRLHAVFRMAVTTTTTSTPPKGDPAACICPVGGATNDCPVHGGWKESENAPHRGNA